VSRVTVVVVNYNTREALSRCLASLGEADEVVVVDNASRDGSAGMVASSFPSVNLVRNALNAGFGRACNQGLDVASGSLVLFLNSDAVVLPGAISALAAVMDTSPDIVACGGLLQFPDGRLQESCCSSLTLWAVFCEQSWLEKLFPRSALFSPYWLSSRLLRETAADARPAGKDIRSDRGTRTFDVEQVMGACLMVRPVEKFDERFFLYCEDTELCHRLRRHGRIVWVPSAVFRHELGASSTARWEAVARYNRGKELFFAIHHGRLASFACFLLNRLGAVLRVLVWGGASLVTLFLVQRFWAKCWMFVRVMFAPVAGPDLPRDASEPEATPS
jgi:N-acetylglucosaminyl-diphospho-decaprenol L-rhamnosyltransferase